MLSLHMHGVHTKKNWHCPDRSPPPGQRGPFFWPSKTTFKRVIRNQIPIENDRENDEYDDVIILMFYHDNAQKSSTTMTLWSKYTSFKHYYLVKKKDQTNRAGVDPP